MSPIERTDSLLLQDRAKWSITGTYNCVGLIVASRRTWVDPEHLVTVLADDGYRQLKRPEEAEAGDVVVYHDADGQPCHAGIVVTKNLTIAGESRDFLTVLSKWGADGEYVHDLTRLPVLLGQPAEYWTDRRTV